MNTDELFVDGYKLPKPLSKEDVYDLIDKMKQGDVSAREKIVEHNIRLVLYEVMSKFKFVEYDKKDLVSIGNIGLMKAIDTFDSSKEVEFATYATRCIDNEILQFLRKIKKDQNVDSLAGAIGYDKDGNELKVEDTLSDDIDIVEEYTDNETYQIIRKIVNELPERDRDIVIMHFGFFNNRRYTQQEIAARFKISQSYVSRLIVKIVKRLGSKLEAQGLIELREKTERDSKKCSVKQKKEGGKEMAKLQTIYEYFGQYTKEQVDEMLSKLTEEERELITLRYGEDLEHPQASEKWNKENHTKFYGKLIPKMRRLLANPNNEKKPRGRKPKSQEGTLTKKKEISSVTKKQDIAPIENEDIANHSIIPVEQTETVVINSNSEEMTREDYLKILELLKTPSFTQMLNAYSPKEAMIVSLKLGYIDGKCFSTSSIASFLGIDSQEVIDTTRTVLFAYQERLNQMINCAIQIATDELSITDRVHNKSFHK